MNQIRHFDLDLAELKRSLVGMGNLVEEALALGVGAILRPVAGARAKAAELEERIDQLDTQIEERCHAMIALQSPMARDLRFLISATRITTDLEQVADLAESIAKRADYIARHHPVPNPEALAPLAELARRMLRQALDAFITGDLAGVAGESARASGGAAGAEGILAEEDEADRLTKECYRGIQAAMQADSGVIKECTHLLRAVGHLEHIADIAVAIADEAAYIHRGQLVRHPRDGTVEP